MKFSVKWLREFVELPDDIDKLAELLTLAGIEIEAIEKRGAKIDKVIVALITASSPHPNADRLSVCQVDDGSGTKRQIVCGAKNYKVGDKVPLALPGTKLPDGTEIRKSKLRGVESEGMLCSAIELGLGQDPAGLLILSPEAKVGAPITDLFPSDTILDVEITPNRGDLLSHYGLAREISALTGKKSRASLPSGSATSTPKGVKISAPNECPFYSLRKIENVKVGPSPDWLRAKIESVGLRSINNIVDISNFVMLELGQPTHAFDAAEIKGEINARLAHKNEKFLALDGKTYSLGHNDLVIADEKKAIGIGGVMGGEESGVSDSTRTVLLEAAYFSPAAIRRTARSLNLPSDASYRFERGVDSGMILPASQRVADLIREVAGGTPAEEIIASGRLPENPADVSLSYAKCDQTAGIEIKPKFVDETLDRFGLTKLDKKPAAKTRLLKAVKSNESVSKWKIPSYRRDLQRDVDLIEEVVRAYGVEKIPGTDRGRFTPSSTADRSHDLEAALRDRLVGRGLSEVRTSKLIPRSATGPMAAVELRNPLSEDYVALRPNLLTGLLAVLDHNVRARAERVAIFELGRVFVPPSGDEERRLGILFWGNLQTALQWRMGEKRTVDFIDIKGAIESLGLSEISLQRANEPDLSLGVRVVSRDQGIGFAGQLRPGKVDVPGSVFIAELKTDLILATMGGAKTFRELARFPAVARDIAMIVPEKVSHAEVLRVIENPKEPMLEHVELFDLFTTNVGEAQKSLAYRLTYRDRSRTLTNEEVTAAHAKIRERLQHELGAELRE